MPCRHPCFHKPIQNSNGYRTASQGRFRHAEDGVEPSDYLIIGSGQVTLVTPPGSQFGALKSFSGAWEQTPSAHAKGKPRKGLCLLWAGDCRPTDVFHAGEETLLFTFSNKSPDCRRVAVPDGQRGSIQPFANSLNSNPGNDISVLGPGNEKTVYFFQSLCPRSLGLPIPGKTVTRPIIHGYEKRRNRRINRP
ncbi:MAG: hypothetical protein IPM82_21760 [Saprospiraceae bacterium]|nr:hypothetical protein [Saprospiraceae bacterium]